MTRTCSVCGRRSAAYYHRASGDAVCGPCLVKRLERFVRKAFGKHGLVAERRPSIAYLVHPLTPLESLAGLHVFSRVEKHFVHELTVLWPRHVCPKGRGIVEEVSAVPVRIVEYDAKDLDSSAERLCRFERIARARAHLALKRLGAGVRYVAIPLPRDYLVALTLDSLMELSYWCTGDSLPKLEAEITFIYPFYEVLWEDLWLLAAFLGLVQELGTDCTPPVKSEPLDLLAQAALAGGPELLYSFTASLSAVAPPPGASRCRVCGGYELEPVLRRNRGACRVCASILQGLCRDRVG